MRASCGIEVAPAPCRAPARNLLVLGGAVHAPGQYAPWQFRLRRAAYESARVLCVGGGIFALAATGLLDGQAVAAPWRSAAAWRALAPKVRFVHAGWTEGRKFHSALGGRALARFLLQCIARQFDTATAGETALALNMEFDPGCPPAASDGQDRLPPRCHPALRAAIRAMHGSLDRPLEIGDICASANNVSERTLQRLFRRHLRTTIGAYHRACRLEHARELLRLTPLSVIEVALTAGFKSRPTSPNPTAGTSAVRRDKTDRLALTGSCVQAIAKGLVLALFRPLSGPRLSSVFEPKRTCRRRAGKAPFDPQRPQPHSVLTRADAGQPLP